MNQIQAVWRPSNQTQFKYPTFLLPVSWSPKFSTDTETWLKNMFISLFYFTRKSHWHHISSFKPLLRKEPLTTIQPNSIQKSKYILLVLVISPDKFSTIFVVVVIIIIRVFPAYKKFLFYPQCKRKIPRNVVQVGVIWIKWS